MRIERLRLKLKEENKFPYVIFSLKNIQYLSNFTGSNALMVIDEEKSFFITDSRYTEYAGSVIPEKMILMTQEKTFSDMLLKIADENSYRQYYFEEHSLTYSQFSQIKEKLKGIDFVPGTDVVNDIRAVKEKPEIDKIRNAVKLADACMEHLLNFIKPGITEWSVYLEIQSFYQNHGSRRIAFDSIVASGAGSSMPHYVTSFDKKIEYGDMVLIDMGCELDGYNSDLTRTVFLGKVPNDFNEIYNTVLEAQLRAIDSAVSGVLTGKLDSIAREHIKSKGYGDYFGHSLGHGLGIEVHELPSVKPEGEYVLTEDNVITIEPGIYIPGKGGVRIEDVVVVGKNAAEILTGVSKKIITI